MTVARNALFPLGQVVATPGALEALAPHPGLLNTILSRHVSGDWGDVDQEDRRANDDALATGARLFSVYGLPDGEALWVITEADRSSSCVLTPSEY